MTGIQKSLGSWVIWTLGRREGGGNLDRKFNHKHKSFCKIWSNLVLQNMANIVGSPQRQIYLLYHQKNMYRILPTNLRISLNPQTTAQVGIPAGKRRLVGGVGCKKNSKKNMANPQISYLYFFHFFSQKPWRLFISYSLGYWNNTKKSFR